jgi:carboxymethylenebutenolidase
MAEMIQVGDISCYHAKVGDSTPVKGAVIVIHEVWGLDDHVKSVADRFADEGYNALAPDLLSLEGVDIKALREMQVDLFNPEKRSEIQPELRRLMAPIQDPNFGQKTTDRVKDCFEFLYDDANNKQLIASVGFCFGGSYSFNLAVAESRLKLAVPFYGHADQSADELSKIACPVRAFYGQNDERLIEGLTDLKERMAQAKVDFIDQVYPGCGHAFFNDTNKYAYNEAAATDAWQKTLTYLHEAFSS